jgi:hypothetical protein
MTMTDAPDEVIYRHGTFAPLVGNSFAIHHPDGGVAQVELVGTTELPGGGECFSLVFRAPADVSLEQCTYQVKHEALGDFPLFLVPLGPSGDGGQDLEAVINRLES